VKTVADTAIEWTDKTWNPVVGCTKVSAGCKNCYAKALHDQRHKAHGEGKKMPAQYARPFEVLQLMPDRLRDPLSWRKPARVFVNSVSDLFHEDVPFEFLDDVFTTMALARRHTFQVLTKRPERMREYFAGYRKSPTLPSLRTVFKDLPATAEFPQGGTLIAPLPNVWLGTSVENQAAGDARIPHLLATPAAVRFLSCEPLLGPVDLAKAFEYRTDEAGDVRYCKDGVTPLGPNWRESDERVNWPRSLGWVIVGGESGSGARPFAIEWARSLVAQCRAASVACFVKQLGAVPTGDYYEDREPYENRGVDWPDALNWNHRDGQPPIGSRVALPLLNKKGGTMDEWPADLRVRELPSAPNGAVRTSPSGERE
jgi:protein gp37